MPGRRVSIALVVVSFAGLLLVGSALAGSVPGGKTVAAPAVEGLRDGESSRETDAIYPGTEPEDAAGRPTVAVTRIVDRRTGRPIAGARLAAIVEHIIPEPAEWGPLRTATAGRDGWARLAIGDIGGSYDWILVEAQGYAPRIDGADLPGEVTRLEPGVDVPIVLRDHFDRACAGVRLGRILGCGHTPDLQRVTTDSQGRAVLRGIDPEEGTLWPVGEGVRSDDLDLGAWQPGDPPIVLRAKAGRSVEGVVLDAAGGPVAGIAVGEPNRHRGPWVRTDADGRFVLHGVGAVPSVSLVPDEAEPYRRPCYDIEPGFPRTLRLPEGSAVDVDEPGAKVAIGFDPELDPPESGRTVVLVTAIRESDHYTMRAWTEGRNGHELELPPGTYTVLAFDRSGLYVPFRDRVEISSEPGQHVRVALTARPTLPVRVAGIPEDGRIHLVTPELEIDVTRRAKQGAPLALPESGPVRLRLDERGTESRFVNLPTDVAAMDPDGATTDPIVIPWSPERAISPGGAHEPAGAVEPAELAGAASLVVWLGDGSPAWGARVEARRVGFVSWGDVDDEGRLETGTDLRPGDEILVTDPGEERLPLRRRLDGPRPWTLAWGDVSITVEVLGADDRPLSEASIRTSGHVFTANETAGVSEIRLLDLDPGAYELLVTAAGHVARTVELRLREGDRRRLVVRLRPSPFRSR